MKNIKKIYGIATEKMWNVVTMAFEAIDFINEHHNVGMKTSEYGLYELCDYIQKAKMIEAPTEQDVKDMNAAIHGASDTLNSIVANHEDAKAYLMEYWPHVADAVLK